MITNNTDHAICVTRKQALTHKEDEYFLFFRNFLVCHQSDNWKFYETQDGSDDFSSLKETLTSKCHSCFAGTGLLSLVKYFPWIVYSHCTERCVWFQSYLFHLMMINTHGWKWYGLLLTAGYGNSGFLLASLFHGPSLLIKPGME